jgi:hypothetical protein
MTMTKQHTDSVLIQQMEILHGENTMTKTPDYNDGEVHWFAGRPAPEELHPMTLVKVSFKTTGIAVLLVKDAKWMQVTAFQVITPHVEPRVWWVNLYENGTTGGLYKNKQDALIWSSTGDTFETIRVVQQPESET